MPRNKPKIFDANGDWTPDYVLFVLRSQKTSLRQLSIANGYAAGSMKSVLRKKWLKAEKIIADACRATPSEIWPSRYHTDGTQKRSRAVYAERNNSSMQALNNVNNVNG